MSQPRMPAIGDAVRRYDDKGEIVFDGFVLAVRDNSVTCVPAAATSDEDGNYSADCLGFVQVLSLVRGLHGWRWAPFDGRSEIGIVTYLHPSVACKDKRYNDQNCERMVLVRRVSRQRMQPPAIDGWVVLFVSGSGMSRNRDFGPGDWRSRVELPVPGYLGGIGYLPDEAVAAAVGGVEGWGWEPSWSGLAPKRAP